MQHEEAGSETQTAEVALGELGAAAVAYARRRWPVFPVHSIEDGRCTCGNPECARRGKHPVARLAPNGLNNATMDLGTIARWWAEMPNANIAIRTGEESGLVVIDVDAGHGGEETLKALVNQHDHVPNTVESLTGGGGRHLLFAHPGIHVPTGVAVLGPGIDVRADGGYIVAPPSLHASGGTYEWDVSSHPDDVAVAPLPEWMLSRLTVPKASSTSLVTLAQPIAEGSRNNGLYVTGRSMRARGVPSNMIAAALDHLNRTCCTPPLSQHEIDRIIHQVVTQEDRSDFVASERGEFVPEVIVRPTAYELNEFLAKEFRDSPSLVGNKIIIPGGLTILAAQPKVGKSMLQLQLALARAYGLPWLGFATTPGRTLYVNAEIAEAEFQARFQAMTAGHNPAPHGTVFTITMLGYYLSSNDGYRLVRAEVERVEPDLLILDPVSALMEGGDSDQENVKPFLHRIACLRSDYGLAVSLVHHHRKLPSKPERGWRPSGQDLSGSGLFHRAADTIITVVGLPESTTLTVYFELRHASPLEPIEIVRQPDLWCVRKGERYISPDLREALEPLLEGPLTHTAWASAIQAKTGMSESTAKRRIKDALSKGYVETSGDKHDAEYRLLPTTREALEAGFIPA